MNPLQNKLKKTAIGLILTLFILVLTIGSLEYFSHYQITKSIHLEAPVITRKSVVINAPIERVWNIFKDVNKWDLWQKEIKSPKLTGSFQAGSTFNWKSNGLTIQSTLNNIEVNRFVSWSGPAVGAFAIHTWRFSQKDGTTTVSVEESMEGWLVWLLKNKFQSSLDTSIENWLNYLKKEAEKA